MTSTCSSPTRPGTRQGQLWFNIFNMDGFIGDQVLTNWLYKPYFEVRARRYRFRILNGSVSRYFADRPGQAAQGTGGEFAGPSGSGVSYDRVPLPHDRQRRQHHGARRALRRQHGPRRRRRPSSTTRGSCRPRRSPSATTSSSTSPPTASSPATRSTSSTCSSTPTVRSPATRSRWSTSCPESYNAAVQEDSDGDGVCGRVEWAAIPASAGSSNCGWWRTPVPTCA